MTIWGFTGISKSLAVIVKCFIWIHVHYGTSFHVVVFFLHLMFTFNGTPEAFVTQTLNCGVQAQVERG